MSENEERPPAIDVQHQGEQLQVRDLGLDGAICGHIHWPMIKEIDGLQYLNCGDWVDSCTAIVEHLDGRMELVLRSATPKASAPRIANI